MSLYKWQPWRITQHKIERPRVAVCSWLRRRLQIPTLIEAGRVVGGTSPRPRCTADRLEIRIGGMPACAQAHDSQADPGRLVLRSRLARPVSTEALHQTTRLALIVVALADAFITFRAASGALPSRATTLGVRLIGARRRVWRRARTRAGRRRRRPRAADAADCSAGSTRRSTS